MNPSLKQRLWLQAAERSTLQALDEGRALERGWQRYLLRLALTYATAAAVMLALTGSLFLAHSLDAGPGDPSDAPGGRTMTSLSVRAEESTLGVGQSVQMTAEGHFNDGSVEPLTSGVGWTSSDAAIANVDAAGLVRAQAPGSSTIAATVDRIQGSLTVTVVQDPPASLLSIALVPASNTLALQQSVQLAATGTFSDGSTAPAGARGTWRSSDPAVAAVDAGGLVTATGTGRAEITLTEDGQTGLSLIEVPAVIEQLRIIPAATRLQVGQSQQLSAQFVYNNGTTSAADQALWSTSDGKVVQVDQSGKADAVGFGPGSATEGGTAPESPAATATITVTQGGFSGAATITVFPPSQVE